MATKPKSYKKDGYTYTESSPGSNRYQNFGAAKPTVKAVRDESRKDKAVVVTSKSTSTPKYRGGPEGDGKAVVSKSSSKPGENKMSRTEATRKTSRMGGMDTGNVMKKSYSSRQGGMDTGNVMKARPLVSTRILAAEYNAEQIAKYKRGEFNAPTKPNTPAPFSKGKGSPSGRKESFMSRSRRKGLIGALFGN